MLHPYECNGRIDPMIGFEKCMSRTTEFIKLKEEGRLKVCDADVQYNSFKLLQGDPTDVLKDSLGYDPCIKLTDAELSNPDYVKSIIEK